MQRTYLLIVSLLIIVLCVAGFEYFSKHFNSPQSSSIRTKQKASSGKISNLEETLKSLLMSNKAEKCTYSTSADATPITGTVYVANRRMKGDFSLGGQQMHINGHMLVNKQFAYMWTDLTKQGFKLSLDEFSASNSAQNSNSQAVDLNQKITYACNNWTADNTIFAVPTGITFSPLTIPTRVVSGIPSVNTSNTSACSACATLPTSAQNICRTKFHC